MKFKFEKIIVLSLVFSASILGNTNIAKAESVVWTTPSPVFVFTNTIIFDALVGINDFTKSVPGALNGVTATVKYNTRVIKSDTGEVISCGSSVPVGTKLKFEFIPHQTEDVSWFGTGATYDSPYGSWKVGGAAPTDLCVAKNFIKEETTGFGGQMKVYTDLSVQPPNKSIAGLPSSCTNVGTDKECLMDTVGTYNANFQFSNTYGLFHYAVSNFGATGFRGYQLTDNSCRRAKSSLLVIDSSNSNFPQAWGILNMVCGFGYCGAVGGMIQAMPASYKLLTRSWSEVKSHIPVAPQQISCPIKVTPIDAIPEVLLEPPVVAKGGSCRVTQAGKGVLYTLRTPVTGKNIKFLIDWNNDGSVDQILPPSGYTAAASLDTTRIWGEIGMKTFSVMIEDEGGSFSSKTVFTGTTDCELPLDPLEEEVEVDDTVIIIEKEKPEELFEGGVRQILTNKRCVLDVTSIKDASGCTLTKNNQDSVALDITAPLELEPGRYTVSCRSFTGQLLASDVVCLLAPDFREI